MNLRKLPREKRNKLIGVVVGTLLILAAMYFLLIQNQNQSLVRLAQKKLEVEASQRRVLDAVHHASQERAR